jgi:hypothetical protein
LKPYYSIAGQHRKLGTKLTLPWHKLLASRPNFQYDWVKKLPPGLLCLLLSNLVEEVFDEEDSLNTAIAGVDVDAGPFTHAGSGDCLRE